ncbi:MAG: PDZ domain-containing protein [Candidatus Omnitrophota bacterium]
MMNKLLAAYILISFFAFLLFPIYPASADIICFKSDKEPLRGLVVDEYSDRVIVSTIDGEREILLVDIKDIQYDTPEQNLFKLGRLYEARGEMAKALVYYQRATEANPRYKEANDAAIIIAEKIRIARINLTRGPMLEPTQKANLGLPAKEAQLKEALGLSLIEEGGWVKAAEVAKSSIAEKSGIEGNDAIIAVMSIPLRYAKMEEVIDRLLGQRYSQRAVTIERYIKIPTQLRQNPGVSIVLSAAGPTVKAVRKNSLAAKAGIKAGDVIYTINNNLTRYQSLRAVNTMLGEGPLELLIRRDITLRL